MLNSEKLQAVVITGIYVVITPLDEYALGYVLLSRKGLFSVPPAINSRFSSYELYAYMIPFIPGPQAAQVMICLTLVGRTDRWGGMVYVTCTLQIRS